MDSHHNGARYNFGISEGEISGERTCKRRSAKHLEFPPFLLEGRRSIHLSYGRVVGYCNPIIELAALNSDFLKSCFLHCAQFCAHLALTWLRTSHPRTGERSATKFGFGYAQRCGPVSKHRSQIRPAGSRTCGAKNRVRTGARAFDYSWLLLSRQFQMPSCVAF